MLTPDDIRAKYQSVAVNRKCIYIPAGQSHGNRLERHLQTVENNGLNGIVIDMKDDLGMIRFDAKSAVRGFGYFALSGGRHFLFARAAYRTPHRAYQPKGAKNVEGGACH